MLDCNNMFVNVVYPGIPDPKFQNLKELYRSALFCLTTTTTSDTSYPVSITALIGLFSALYVAASLMYVIAVF